METFIIDVKNIKLFSISGTEERMRLIKRKLEPLGNITNIFSGIFHDEPEKCINSVIDMYLKNSSIKILSVGSGKCVIESIITDLFGIPIICIDPAPNSFNFVPRDSPFQKYVRNPDYKNS